jgi:hypothetical protein
MSGELNSRTFQGHSRPCISKFKDFSRKFKDFSRTFKAMYQQIQGLNTEEKALEISKI